MLLSSWFQYFKHCSITQIENTLLVSTLCRTIQWTNYRQKSWFCLFQWFLSNFSNNLMIFTRWWKDFSLPACSEVLNCASKLKLSAVTSKLLQLEALAGCLSQLVSISRTFGESDRRINMLIQLWLTLSSGQRQPDGVWHLQIRHWKPCHTPIAVIWYLKGIYTANLYNTEVFIL